jgi:hypothetical protein
MLEAMGAVQVRRNDHLVVEAIDGVVEVHVVEPELNARNRQDVAEVAECRADPRRKGSVEPFQGVALLGLCTVRVSKRDANLAAAGALVLDAERKVHELFGEKQKGVAEQVDLPSRSRHEV